MLYYYKKLISTGSILKVVRFIIMNLNNEYISL